MEKIILDPLKGVIVLFFYVLLFLGIIIIELLLLSSIKVTISNLKLSTEKYEGRILNDDYTLTISLWGLRRFCIINIEITKEKLENIKLKEKLKTSLRNIATVDLIKNIMENRKIDKKTLKKVKKHAPEIMYIKLLANIGTDDAILTSYIVAFISSLLGIGLREPISKFKKNKFIINPVYINKNLLNLELDCIFETKMIHIIYVIYILNKKRRVDKNGRTSNRRTYGYSYE